MFLGSTFYKIDFNNQELLQMPVKVGGIEMTPEEGYKSFPITAALSYDRKGNKGTSASGKIITIFVFIMFC